MSTKSPWVIILISKIFLKDKTRKCCDCYYLHTLEGLANFYYSDYPDTSIWLRDWQTLQHLLGTKMIRDWCLDLSTGGSSKHPSC